MTHHSFRKPDTTWLAGWYRAVLSSCVGASLLGLVTITAAAQTNQIPVKWDDPQIKKFQQRTKTRGVGPSTLFDPRLAKLKLPVLGFEKPMPNVRSAFGVSPPRARRTLTMDESNPIWYELSYDYGDDVKVTIDADLRIQSKLPSDAKVYAAPRNFATDEAEISVFDDRSEVGMIGAIAEFKVYRFGQVPYTVTIECSEKKKAVCQDVEALKSDKQFLRLISASPPKQ
ncbi:MAG: hypothetical protein ACI8W7_004786 [Gammaproteobacteria bacterium]